MERITMITQHNRVCQQGENLELEIHRSNPMFCLMTLSFTLHLSQLEHQHSAVLLGRTEEWQFSQEYRTS